MYEINPKFLRADGTFNTEAATVEGRKARAQAMGRNLKIISKTFRRLIRSNKNGNLKLNPFSLNGRSQN